MENDKINFSINQPESYWIASCKTNEFPSLIEGIHVDVAIIGCGISGILSAYMLKNKGVNIALFDANRVLHGTTGHTTAKITSQHGLIYNKLKNQISTEIASQYAYANELAINKYKELIDQYNIDCDFQRESAYLYTQQEKYLPDIVAEAEAAQAFHIAASYTDTTPLPFSTKGAVRFDKQAQFNPLKFLNSLINTLVSDTCRIYENTPIVNMEHGNKIILTASNGSKITADKVIIASHYPFWNKPGFYFTRIYPERSYVIAIKSKNKFPGGMYITAEDPGRSLRSVNTDIDELILVGGEHHKTGQSSNTDKHYHTLIKFAETNFGIIDVPYHWSTQDCLTMDSLPYTGNLTSKTPNIYVTTGYGKWGMTNSMASALLLSDLIIKGDNPWKDAYSPSRHTISASSKNFIIENFNVAENLIEGKLSHHPEDIKLHRGEGTVIKVDNQRIGAHLDDNGDLHMVNTTCTHMGCELNWNSAERTWDCPCHGSRFNCSGNVVEGPAVHKLDMHEDVNTIQKLIKDDF